MLILSFVMPLFAFADGYNKVLSNDSIETQSIQGFYVQGNVLAIFDKSVLSVKGNVVLNHANIQGEGTLMLTDNKDIDLVSTFSSVQHLVINNTHTVTLRGSLTIQKSLKVQQGTFDVQHGNLILAENAIVQIYPQATIIQRKNIITLPLLTIPFFQIYDSPLCFLKGRLSNGTFFNYTRLETDVKYWLAENKHLTNPFKNKIDNPPEG